MRGERAVDRWLRPSAKRLCEFVIISPGHRVGRGVACDVLFANLGPVAAGNALSRALWMAREALAALGEDVPAMLQANRAYISLFSEVPVDIDLVRHEDALRSALGMSPGPRDAALSAALVEERALLEDEPYTDWAIRPREALELLRQTARLQLARDRARGSRAAPTRSRNRRLGEVPGARPHFRGGGLCPDAAFMPHRDGAAW